MSLKLKSADFNFMNSLWLFALQKTLLNSFLLEVENKELILLIFEENTILSSKFFLLIEHDRFF